MTQKTLIMALAAGLAGWLGPGTAAEQVVTAGPFTIEAVERKVGGGGFPNTSGNFFKRVPVTTYRVLHKGKPVAIPGTAPDRGAPWWEARVLTGAPQPALLLMESTAVLLTEADGQARVQVLAPSGSPRTQWQWLDAEQGQPGPVNVVAIAHRPGHPRELAGGRWLAVNTLAVLDVKTLAVHRYRLNDSAVLDQLDRFYAAEKPVLAFSPGGTQFVVSASRDRPGETDLRKRFDHALVAFDFAAQRGTVLPIVLADWRLQGSQDIDAAFARRVVAWRRGPDGAEQATLRQDLPRVWLGKVNGRETQSTSYTLQPVRPSMQKVLAAFLESEFQAVLTPRATGTGQDARIGDLTLTLNMIRPEDEELSLFHLGDWQRSKDAFALIERIAERFNALLAAGQHQQHFVGGSAVSAAQPAR